MSKAGNFGIILHQTISFHPLMMRLPRTDAVFWPGCALMQLDTAILHRTMEILRRAEPQIALSPCCCGQPTIYAVSQGKGRQRQQTLAAMIKARGIRRIYTACPNCSLQLRQLNSAEVFPIWPVLAQLMTAQDVSAPPHDVTRYIWHDPCPTRNDPAQQEAVRKLLALTGADVCQPTHTGGNTLCCGNFHMLHITNPEVSAAMRQKRLAELPEDRVIASSCDGCLSAFRSEGRQTQHLLELLFGQSRRRGWGNRIRTTFSSGTK